MNTQIELYNSKGQLAIDAIPQSVIDGLDDDLRLRFETLRCANLETKLAEAEQVAARVAQKEATSLIAQRSQDLKKFSRSFLDEWRASRG